MNSLLRPKTFQEYQAMSLHIYGEANDRHYSEEDLIARLIEEISVVMELVRKDRRAGLKLQLPKVFMWYLAVANRLRLDLQETLWEKYPGVCPYCMHERDCICGTEHPEIPNKSDILRRFVRDREGNEPQTLKEHQKLHHRLYGWQNERILSIQTAAHLAEEAGELSKEFRHRNQDGIRGEMADIASWIFALATRLEHDLHTIVWESFPYECELCKKDVCECPTVP